MLVIYDIKRNVTMVPLMVDKHTGSYARWPDHGGRLQNGGTSFLNKERRNENESVEISWKQVRGDTTVR